MQGEGDGLGIDHAGWGQGRVAQRRQEGNSRSPTLPSLCQQGVQAGFAPLCSESAKLAQAQIAPKIGREEEVF